MSTPTTADDLGPHSVMGDALEHRPRPTPVRVARRSDMLAYLLLVSLTLAVWQFTRLGLYTAQSDTGYWMGVVGGVLMLLLFAYPLRKRWAWLAGKGKAKHWFVVHMVLGIFGPLLVLAHSTFQIGSVNAGVALFSMLIVSASGVAGRFIYLRIHRGLGGEKLTLEALRQTLGFTANSVRSQLHFAPLAEARLRALDVHAGTPGDRWVDHLQRLLVLDDPLPEEEIEIDLQETAPPPPPPREERPIMSKADDILTDAARRSTISSMAKLAGGMPINKHREHGDITLEDIVREMLHPMLKDWLSESLPPMVERMVQKELEKLARRAQDV